MKVSHSVLVKIMRAKPKDGVKKGRPRKGVRTESRALAVAQRFGVSETYVYMLWSGKRRQKDFE